MSAAKIVLGGAYVLPAVGDQSLGELQQLGRNLPGVLLQYGDPARAHGVSGGAEPGADFPRRLKRISGRGYRDDWNGY